MAATTHRRIFRVKLQSQLLSLAPFSLEFRSWTRDHFQAGCPWCVSSSLRVPLCATLQGCPIKHWEHLGAHALFLRWAWHQHHHGTCLLPGLYGDLYSGTKAPSSWCWTAGPHLKAVLSEASLRYPWSTGMSAPQSVYRRLWAKDLSNLCDEGVVRDTNFEPPLKERFIHQLYFN